MASATVQNSIGSQIEYTRNELPVLFMLASRLWKRIGVRTDVKPVSNRPARIPFLATAGAKFRSANFDGQDMNLGSGPQETNGNLSCASFLQCSEYTALAEWSTASDEQAIKNYVTLTQTQAAKTFAGYMDATFQGDGSNTLDTVVSTATQGLVVNNANLFQDNQDLDCYSALTGAAGFIATVTIDTVDIANNIIWLTAAVPAGVTTGTKLLVAGSAGIANSGLAGLRAYQVSGNSGSYMGIQRSAFPGKFSTPSINVGGSLTPAIVRALEAQIELAIGLDEADAVDLVAHANVDMRAAWENVGLLVTSNIYQQIKGDQSEDMLKKRAPTMIAGRELLVNERAVPGLIDFLALKNWFRIETKPLDYYEVGGQTIFPGYGISGGLSSNVLFYLVNMCQTGLSTPRAGGYLSNVTIPSKYFGQN
tara:strand:- start:4954 stop:6219 length:1266 start_codon:yes stop_codon:yes gene_type:complete